MTKPVSLTAVVALILAAPLAAAPPQLVDEALRELRAGAPGLAASRSRLTFTTGPTVDASGVLL